MATVANKALPWCEIGCHLFFESDLTGSLPDIASLVPLLIRPAQREDIAAFAAALETAGVHRGEVQQRLRRGEALILALSREQLVHIQWLAFRPLPIHRLGLFLRLGPGEAYAYNSFTFPAWRGQGVQPAVKCFCFRYLRDRGYTREISYVDASNAASLRIREKLGYRRTKTVWSLTTRHRDEPLVAWGVTHEGSPSLARFKDGRSAGA